jgi:hypothetical protein
MPINLPNFLGVETESYGPGNLLESAIEGYKAARLPKQISQEEKYRELANKLIGEQGTKVATENKYLPHKLENEARTSDIELNYLPKEKGANLNKTLLGNEEQQMKNAIMKKYGMTEAQAKIALDLAHGEQARANAKFAHLLHQTPEMRNAQAAGFAPGSPEYQNILRGSLGIFEPPTDDQGNPIPLPKNARTLNGISQSERKVYSDEMRAGVRAGNYAQKANRSLDKIIKITKENPKLNRSWSYIAADPDDEGKWARAVKGLNEKEQTQLALLKKYTNEVSLYQSDTGNTRATNLFRQMVTSTKPGIGMTDEARTRLSNEIKQSNDPLIKYAREAAPWIGHAYIPFQEENYYQEPTETSELTAEENAELSQLEAAIAENKRQLAALK